MSINDRDLLNPARNQLSAGLSIEKIESAIVKSGYPLQTHVAKALRALGFQISPEWSYIDRDKGELRSLDMRASMRLYEPGNQTRSRPSIALLVECKQSELPLVFFTGEQMPWDAQLPFFVGQKCDEFTIFTNDTLSRWTCDLQQALHLRGHEFFSRPPVAYTISKAQRKGSDIILSGDDVYNSIVLPLVKSLHHLKIAEKPPKTAIYFDIHYAVAIAVVDGPIIAFQDDHAHMAPWIRVVRHEAGNSAQGKIDRGLKIPIDVVHRDFLESYISDHLLPAAHDFAEKTLRHAVEVADQEGFIKNLNGKPTNNYEMHLEPKPVMPLLKSKRNT